MKTTGSKAQRIQQDVLCPRPHLRTTTGKAPYDCVQSGGMRLGGTQFLRVDFPAVARRSGGQGNQEMRIVLTCLGLLLSAVSAQADKGGGLQQVTSDFQKSCQAPGI